MRKYIKKELVKVIDQLLNIATLLNKRGKDLCVEHVIEILTECQQSAVGVGERIELIEGNETNVVEFLEEYCEKIYMLSVEWEKRKRREELLQDISLLLIQIKSSIWKDFPDEKKEVVFLPYKAAMWDSLESIWKAAVEDDNCNVHVVPIPYFDKKPDGSVKEMYYEGNLYPEYVPITDWKVFDLEKLHPDAIFIHNPYDECNYVTSVHPKYYAKEIRNYTEELVYVPYFVYRDIEPSDQESINNMKHFVTTPGVVYADRVFVQSQNMEKIYVEEYFQYLSEVNGKLEKKVKESLKKKIKGLGSPKYDKIVNSERKDYVIPKEWLAKIGDKKVVLFNTSVKGLLVYEDNYLDKLERIIELFQGRNDYVLWWRPHPLLLSAFESMRPSLAERYKKIVENYRKKDIGIYDDTSDLNRAIAFSDKYYGDKSSVLELYGATGKPALISIINQRARKESEKEINTWRTGDVETSDLEKWLDGKEEWILKKEYKEMNKGLLLDGQCGKRIYEYIMEEMK